MSRELPLNPNGTELGAKSENGARHECIIYDGTAGAIWMLININMFIYYMPNYIIKYIKM